MNMEYATKIPIIGGLIDAMMLYGRVLLGFLRSPISFVPDFCLKDDTQVAKGIEILFAGLVVTYLILVPYLKTAGALTAQPVFLFFMMLRYLLLIPVMHFAFILFGSSTSFQSSVIFWLIYLGITLPIGVLLQYPTFIAIGADGFIYGFSQWSEETSAIKEFYAKDPHASLFTVLSLAGMAINIILAIIVSFWFKRVYLVGWWRCITAGIVGCLVAFGLDAGITQPIWKIIEPYIVSLAKIS